MMNTTISSTQVVVLPDGRLDAKNAATYCGLSIKTMAMKRCTGTGPRFVKIGRVFYFVDDLDAWLQRSRVVSTAESHQIRQGDSNDSMRQFHRVRCIEPGISGAVASGGRSNG